MATIKKPVNYLNNKDILKEIHLSKTSYCSFVDPSYHQYDAIVEWDDNTNLVKTLEQVFKPEIIQLARETRANRMDVELEQPKGTTDPLSIPITDLVFRVMTWDHIPIAPKQPRKVDKSVVPKILLTLTKTKMLLKIWKIQI